MRYSVRRPCERTELEGMLPRKPGPPGAELEETGRLPESLQRDHVPDDTLSSDLCPQEHVSSGFQVCSNCHGSHRKLTPRIANPLGVRVEKD